MKNSLVYLLCLTLTIIMISSLFQTVSAEDFSVIDGKFIPKKKIIVGGDNHYPPYTFLDKNGKPQGLSTNLIRLVAKEMDIELEFRFTGWGQAIKNLKNGETDVIIGIMYSEKRKNIFDYSIPHTTEYHAIFVRRDSSISRLSDLQNKELIAQKGDVSFATFFKPLGYTTKVFYTPSLPESIKLLNSGKHDFVIAPYSIGMQTLSTMKKHQIKIIGPPMNPSVYRFAVKKGNSHLLTVLNEGLDRLKAGDKIRPLEKKWIKYIRNDWTLERAIPYILWVLAFLVVLILALFLWSSTLRREIRKKSKYLREALNEAKQASIAKSNFLAHLSHEIRTPLNAISGFSHVLQEISKEQTFPKNSLHYLNNIYQSSDTLSFLVNEVLDLSKIEAGKVEIKEEPINLEELLLRIYRLNKDRSMEKGVLLNYAIDEALPKIINCDKSILTKIIANLVSNAIKFTELGGAIWFKAKKKDQQLLIQVEDEGVGISAEDQKLIFKPFEQVDGTSAQDQGSGLGLTIVYENVKLLGGDINLKSQLGGGSSFSVLLPLNTN